MLVINQLKAILGAPHCRFHGMAHWLTNLVSSDGIVSDILSLRQSQLPHPAFLCLSLGQSYMDTLILNSLLVWEYLLSPAKNLSFICRVSGRLAMFIHYPLVI